MTIEKITYVSVTQNRVENLKRNLPAVLPYVDAAIIVDGGSSDGTQEYLESLSPKVTRIFRKWDDNFANQFNFYLPFVDNGWILICDDDELPSEDMLKSLRSLIEESNYGNNFCCVEFQCENIDPEANYFSGPTGYYRQIFFRKNSNMKYKVDLHQSLVGYQNGKFKKSDKLYYHIKTVKQEMQNACRNYFIGGYWPPGANHPVKDHTWNEMKDALSKDHPEVSIFSEFNNLMISGNIGPNVKAWIIKYKDITSQGYNELKCFYKYYFQILHPEHNK